MNACWVWTKPEANLYLIDSDRCTCTNHMRLNRYFPNLWEKKTESVVVFLIHWFGRTWWYTDTRGISWKAINFTFQPTARHCNFKKNNASVNFNDLKHTSFSQTIKERARNICEHLDTHSSACLRQPQQNKKPTTGPTVRRHRKIYRGTNYGKTVLNSLCEDCFSWKKITDRQEHTQKEIRPKKHTAAKKTTPWERNNKNAKHTEDKTIRNKSVGNENQQPAHFHPGKIITQD